MATNDSLPRFTVVIPTKDRASYLYHTLRTCSAQDYDNLEIVVSDDGSSDHTREVVEDAAARDSRIRYASPGDSVGMLDNFEFALRQAKPGFVMALGGDDGLMPYGIRGMHDCLRATQQEILAWPAPIYFYPKTRMEMGQLVMNIRRGRPLNGHRVIDSASFLRRQARQLAYVSDIESPMFYVKGVTSTALIDRVRRRSADGRFYSCATPDGYSGIVLAGEVPTYGFSGQPFSIFGGSPTSAGLAYLAKGERARMQSEAFFAKAKERPMHRDLASQPYSPLIALMTADYLLTASDLPGWPGVRPAIDYRALLRRAIGELQDGLFGHERVARELRILYAVARYHGLGGFFRQVVRKARQNARTPLKGDAISTERVYFDADRLGIQNIFDASYFAYYAHTLSAGATPGRVWTALLNSARYKTLSMRRGAPFPPESDWLSGGSA